MLFYLLWIPAALTALGIFLACPAMSAWWLLLILPLAFLLWNGLYLLYTWIICKRVDMDAEWTGISPFYQKNTQLFIDWLLAVLRVRYELRGTEWLPEGEFLLVGNHRSAFDPLTTYDLAGRDFVDILVPLVENGERVGEPESIETAKMRCREATMHLDPSFRRFLNPQTYPVGLEPGLADLRQNLARRARA